MPMLAGLRVAATHSDRGGHLVLSSFDLEVSGRIEVSADVEETGVALVNGRLLVDIAKSLPAQPVRVAVEGSRLRLQCGRASFELPTLPADEYPQLPPMPQASGSVSGSVLASAVAQVAVAAGRDEALPFLTGVRVEVTGDLVTLAATDRYRLAVCHFNWQPVDDQFNASALVPARTLADTVKALSHAPEVQLAFGSGGLGEGLLGIEGLSRRTTTRLLEGAFVDYRKLLPTESLAMARVNSAALIEAVKRVSLVAERSSAIRMQFNEQELIIEAGAGDDPIAVDAIECVLEGGPLERIAFNPNYLLEGLAAVNCEFTNMSFTLPGKPTVMTAGRESVGAGSSEYLYLLMPVRLPA
jgi:DNA polymerase-3 subunit beta